MGPDGFASHVGCFQKKWENPQIPPNHPCLFIFGFWNHDFLPSILGVLNPTIFFWFNIHVGRGVQTWSGLQGGMG